jgi:hypothetical protein
VCWFREPIVNIIMFVLCNSHLTSLGLDFFFLDPFCFAA